MYNFRIEWEAHDYHSGLYSLSWRLYDNFTGINITHGHNDLHTQGDFEVILNIQM